MEIVHKLRAPEGSVDMSEYILLRHREIPDLDHLDVYRQQEGFRAFKKAVTDAEASRSDRDGQGIWPARAGRRRISDRHEMVVRR